MRITCKLYGNLKSFAPARTETFQMEVEPGVIVAALLAQLGVPDDRVWMSVVNDNATDGGAVLHENDVLEVFEPVGGGTIGDTLFDKRVQLDYSRASLSRGIKGAKR